MDEYFDAIVTALKSVKRPGCYATGGLCSLPLPSLSINSAPEAILGLPLADSQVKTIIDSATQAPFGRGEETIVDTAVRRTWQLNPTQFSINNPQWSEQLQTLLGKVKADLGCDAQKMVSCELYKLLLYEPGGFFKRHRDTEKAEGMFGTLVIQLPSNFSGGQLAVYHQSKSMEFDFGGPVGCSNFHYAAFYADCQHEIKPVNKGDRLCLIYNLMYDGLGSSPVPANNQQIVSDIISSMREWNEDVDSAGCPPMMTYLLEHQYCDASLSFQLLKNTDRAVADVLIQAKNELEFDLFLAKVNLTQNWSASHDYDYGYHGCHGRGSYSAEDLIDEEVSADNLKGHDGRTISSISLESEYFVPEDFFDTIDPDNEEFEEATGNEGATLDKQYSWAALLLWPAKKRTVNIGIANVIRSLQKDLLDQTVSSDKRAELKVVAEDVVRLLQSCESGISAEVYVSFLQSLQILDDKELIVRFLEASLSFVSSIIGSPSVSKEILAISRKYGWNMLRSFFQALAANLSRNFTNYFQFLRGVSQDQLLEEQKDICQGFASAIVSALSKEGSTNYSYWTSSSRAEEYVLFLQSLQGLGSVELISHFLCVIASCEVFHQSLVTNSSFTNELLAVCSTYGWDIIRSPLKVISGKASSSIEKYYQFLIALSHGQPREAAKDACRCLATAIVNALSKEQDTKPSNQPTRYTSHGVSRGKEFLLKVFKCLMALEYNEQLLSLVLAIRTKPNRYPVNDMLVPVCENLWGLLKGGKEQKEPLEQLISYCISSLEASCSRAIPDPPADWSEPVTLSCSCEDCAALMRFLKHPTETQHRFRMVQRRRNHLQKHLNRCPVTHATERLGSPHTLVVTKTQATYRKKCENYRKEKATLSRLQALVGGSSSSSEPSVKRQRVDNVVDLTEM